MGFSRLTLVRAVPVYLRKSYAFPTTSQLRLRGFAAVPLEPSGGIAAENLSQATVEQSSTANRAAQPQRILLSAPIRFDQSDPLPLLIFKDPSVRHMSLRICLCRGTSFEAECPRSPMAGGGERPDDH